MDTIFMHSKNSRISEYHVLVLKLADKLDLRRDKKVLLYQILVLFNLSLSLSLKTYNT